MTEKQFNNLFTELCVELGFCLSAAAQQSIVTQQPNSATALANAIYSAEGLDPRLHSDLYKAVHTKVDAALQKARLG